MELEKVHGAVFTCTAGDVLEVGGASASSDPKIRAMKARAMFEGFELLRYDAVAVGEMDLAYGMTLLREMEEKHGIPFVCANAFDRGTENRLFEPYRIAEKNGLRVAFLGVVSPERHVIAPVESQLLEHKIEIRDPTEEAAKLLPEIRENADVVVLLSHTGIETSEFLAKDLAVDVVIVGHYPAIENDPRKVGNAIFCMAGSKSDRFGTLQITWGADGKTIESFDGDAIRLLQTGPEVPEIAAIFERVDAAEKEATRQRSLAGQRESEAERLKGQTAKVHDRGGVLGAESCKTCHAPTYDSWLKTPHAEAFAALAEADAWDNPECVGCHVTGAAEKHRVEDANIAPELWNVQCEECHGSGLDHARDGSYVTAGEATCRKCHDAANSPEFDYERYKSYGIH